MMANCDYATAGSYIEMGFLVPTGFCKLFTINLSRFQIRLVVVLSKQKHPG